MAKPNGKNDTLPRADEWTLKSILMLLANIAYVETPQDLKDQGVPNPPMNRFGEMGQYRITSDMLEKLKLPDEAHYLATVEALLAEGIAPTYQAIQTKLAFRVGNEGRAVQIVGRISAHRSLDPDVTSLAFGVGEDLKTRYLLARMYDLADTVVGGPYGTYPDKFEQVMDELSALAPLTRKPRHSDYDGLWDLAAEYSVRAVENKKKGIVMGPQFPWAKLNQLVGGGMERGDIFLFTGPTKIGKTTFASQIGRHIAFTQDNFLVLQLHLETNQLTLGIREMCARWRLKPADIRSGLIDVRKSPWKEKLARAKAEIELRCGVGDESRYWYEHVPGLDITEFKYLIRRYQARAEAMGLELVVILDYFGEMSWNDLKGANSETQGLNILASLIKEVCDDYGIYLILFAQESDDEDKPATYMAHKIIKRSQAQVRILRGRDKDTVMAAFDRPVPQKDEKGNVLKDDFGRPVPYKDGLGRDMYWHREGQYNSLTRLHLMRGNNVETGYAYLSVANGYFMVLEEEESLFSA